MEIVHVLIKERFSYNHHFLFGIFDRLLARRCALHMAVMNGQIETIRKIIESTPEAVTTSDRCGRTVLHMIALYAVQYPLLSNIFPWTVEQASHFMAELQKDMLGYNPLDYAVANRSFAIANCLCKNWRKTIIIVDINEKVKTKYLDCALAGYEFLFENLLKCFAVRDLLFRRTSNSTLISSYIKKVCSSFSTATVSKYNEITVSQFLSGHIYTSLFYMVAFDTKNDVERFISTGVDVNMQDEYGNTPLYYAVLHDKLDMVHMLLLHGADVNHLNCKLQSPLHFAAQSGHVEILRKLLAVHTKVNVHDENGDTPLHLVLKENNSEAGDLLINSGASIYASNNHQSCLHALIESKCDELLINLLTKGVCSDEKDFLENTPFHLCLKKKKIRAANLLILNGAQINSTNRLHESTLYSAISAGDINIVELIISNGATVHDKELLEAVNQKEKAILELLILSGADVNYEGSHRKSVIHHAANRDFKDGIAIILKHGGNIDHLDKDGNTPLNFILNKCVNFNRHGKLDRVALSDVENISIAKFLMFQGARVDIPNKKKKTPLHCIIDFNLDELFHFILGMKPKRCSTSKQVLPNFNVQDEKGNSVLHCAVKKDKIAFVREILKGGGSANVQNNFGDSPLHIAARNGNVEMMQALVDAGADVGLKSQNQCSVLFEAVISKHFDLVEYLLGLSDFDLNEEDASGRTVLHYAVMYNCPNIAIKMLEHGASIDKVDSCRDTVLHLAVRNDNLTIVQVLLKYRPSIDIINDSKETAQSLAYQKGNNEMIHLFQQYCVQLYWISNK